MPDVGCCALIHPNVAVMWNKVQCRIGAIWGDTKCDVVQCQVMRCAMMVWCMGNMVVC